MSLVNLAAQIGTNLPILRWLLSHGDKLDDLMEGVDAVMAAEGVLAKWQAVKAIGDLLATMLDDFPGIPGIEFSTAPPTEQDAQQLLDIAGNIDTIRKLIEYLPQILAIIQIIKEAMAKMTPATPAGGSSNPTKF